MKLAIEDDAIVKKLKNGAIIIVPSKSMQEVLSKLELKKIRIYIEYEENN